MKAGYLFAWFVLTLMFSAPTASAQGTDALTEGALAPLPENAAGPAIDPAKGYLVEEVSGGLYFVTDGLFAMMFLVTGEGVIAVDAPPTIGENILKAIADVTDEPITHVIYSHSHSDHIGAAGLYPEDAVYIAQQQTKTQLEAALDPERRIPYGAFVGGGAVPLPTVTFQDEYALRVGSQYLELAYKGVNHEPGNIFIYAPAQRTLMLVDVIFPGWTPYAELAVAENVLGYYAAHDQVLAYDFDVFIGGHLNRTGTRADVERQRDYMQDIQQNVLTALQTVDYDAIVQEVGFEHPWELFRVYLDEVAQTCADLTIRDWVDTLGDVEVWTHSHCWTVSESIRID